MPKASLPSISSTLVKQESSHKSQALPVGQVHVAFCGHTAVPEHMKVGSSIPIRTDVCRIAALLQSWVTKIVAGNFVNYDQSARPLVTFFADHATDSAESFTLP